MPTCPKCQAETQPKWAICPFCEQPLPKPAICPRCGRNLDAGQTKCPSCDAQGGGIANTDAVMRAGGDIVGRDKQEGDFRQAGGASIGGGININVAAPNVVLPPESVPREPEANKHFYLIIGAALFLAAMLGVVAMVALSRSSATISSSPQLANTSTTKKVKESHIEVAAGTKELRVTAYGVYTPSESDSRQSAEEKAYQKAHDEAGKLVIDRLMTTLMPEEHERLHDLVATWGSGKLQITNKRIDNQDAALVAMLEGGLSVQEFENYLGLKRKSQLSPQDNTTPFEVDFGFYRQQGQRIADGGTINSGEQFWLEFKSSKDCYVYVLNEGSSGNIIPLYPRPDIDKDSSVKQGKAVRLPADDYDYRADQKPGPEKIILVASLAPLNDIEYFARKFTQGKADPSDHMLLAQEIKTRDIKVAPGIGLAAKKADAASNPQLEIEKLSGRGSLVRTVVFEHR